MHAGKDGLAIDKILEYAEKEFVVPEPEKQYADMHMYVDVKVDKMPNIIYDAGQE